jgi:hypothetical protein
MTKEDDSTSYEMVPTNKSTEDLRKCSEEKDEESGVPLLFDTTAHDSNGEDNETAKGKGREKVEVVTNAPPAYDPPMTAPPQIETTSASQLAAVPSQEAPPSTTVTVDVIPPKTETASRPTSTTNAASTASASATLPPPVIAPRSTPRTTIRAAPVVLPAVVPEPTDYIPPVVLIAFGAWVTFSNIIAGIPIFLVGLHFLMKISSGHNLRQLNNSGYMNLIFAWLVIIFIFYGIRQEVDEHKALETVKAINSSTVVVAAAPTAALATPTPTATTSNATSSSWWFW